MTLCQSTEPTGSVVVYWKLVIEVQQNKKIHIFLIENNKTYKLFRKDYAFDGCGFLEPGNSDINIVNFS